VAAWHAASRCGPVVTRRQKALLPQTWTPTAGAHPSQLSSNDDHDKVKLLGNKMIATALRALRVSPYSGMETNPHIIATGTGECGLGRTWCSSIATPGAVT
jgi:hypothetical protein